MKKPHPKEHYSDYLQLGKLLSAQKPLSSEAGQPAHDELFFIIIHQVYELWFKQIISDFDSIFAIFKQPSSHRDLELILMRLQRISKIFHLLIQQLEVIETLTPLQFLDFRGLLGTMSGFQSCQFRLIEAKFGLKRHDRVAYAKCPYDFEMDNAQKECLHQTESSSSLFDYVEQWLQDLPYLKAESFDFEAAYRQAYEKMDADTKKDEEKAQGLSDEEKHTLNERRVQQQSTFNDNFGKEPYQELLSKGQRRLSYQAFLAALFIRLYRNYPVLHVPDLLLTEVLDVNATFLLWRYRHSLMVQKMIGWKRGTGGSSGVHYLQETVEKYDVFADLYVIPMVLLPRKYTPALPPNLIQNVSHDYPN